MQIRIISMMFLACILGACSGSDEKKENTEALSVKTETISLDGTLGQRSYVGEVDAKTSTAVSFTGTGMVQRMLVSSGQHVGVGQTIAVMDPTQAQNAVQAAEATMMQAQDAYDRMKVLHDRQSVSELDWVDVQSKYAQAKSSLQMAKKMLAECTLKAPCAGVIGTKYIESGMVALPAQPVCTILDINTVNIKVAIPETEIGSITATTPSTIRVAALDGEIFHGEKIEKDVVADAITHTYNINIRVNNSAKRLLPGMVASVTLSPAAGSDAQKVISLPVKAVQQNASGEKFVWVVRDGKSHRQTVTIGDIQGNRIAILSGLAEGEKVIVEGYQKVSENQIVKD